MLKDEFLKRAKDVHNGKYTYLDLQDEVKVTDRITVVCPIHGSFPQVVSKHLSGQQCKKCSDIEKGRKRAEKSFIKFKETASKKFKNKYDYSKAVYIDNTTPIEIICPIHGSFKQNPAAHLKSPIGCNECVNEKMRELQAFTKEEFIERAKKVHGDKYDYSKVEYVNNRTPVIIICPKHGEFEQTPDGHLQGQGCKRCYYERLASSKLLTTEEFIRRAKEMHGDRYIYDETEYKSMKEDVYVKCPIHGIFKQNANNHLHGEGCPQCNPNRKSKLENEVKKGLEDFEYIPQKEFKFLNKGKGKLKLDFYLPQHNIAIECQGLQHFIPIKHFNGEEGFKKCQNRDIRKKQLCEEHGVKLYYFSHENFDEFLGEKVYHNIDELIEKIANNS